MVHECLRYMIHSLVIGMTSIILLQSIENILILAFIQRKKPQSKNHSHGTVTFRSDDRCHSDHEGMDDVAEALMHHQIGI